MNKFTLKDISNLVNEELEKYSKKQALISERNKLENELKKLNEVSAGEDLESEKDYTKGQKEAEFTMKGSHIVEDSVNEGVEEMVHFKEDEVYLFDEFVGKMVDGEFKPEGDELVMKVFGKPKAKSSVESLFNSSIGNSKMVGEIENDFNDPVMEDDSRMKRFDTDFEGLGDGPEFDASEFKDPVPDMADQMMVPDAGMSDEEAMKSELPTWMMGEAEDCMEEEVDLDAQIKQDLEEMMDSSMAEDIYESVKDLEEEKDCMYEDEFDKGGMDDMDEGSYKMEGDHEMKEEMDPIGKEDSDINNDGKSDDSDEYLKNKRDAIGKSMSEESEGLMESIIDKRRKNIMSESTLNRMKILTGQSKRWDRD